jgi:signal transduction histidine kinase
LLLFLQVPLPVSSLFFKPFVTSLSLVEAPYFLESVFFKSLIPVVLFVLLAWTDDRLKHDRISSLTGQLKIASENLEQESARLEQQKKFTAMLTHELKNPLMASQMALSSIQTRLGVDDPSLPRVNSISHSLQEIDAIIERCAEIDKYEQGYFPLAMGRHSLGDLFSLIKASYPSERVYTIVRGANDDFEFRTDLYYLRIVLNNLLSNALKYSVADSLVEFKVEHLKTDVANELVFSVANEVVPDGAPDPGAVFMRYYRSETAKQQSGAGLGLWLAQSMTHALGSHIQLTIEENVVRFHFSVPV